MNAATVAEIGAAIGNAIAERIALPRYFTHNEVAESLHVSERTVRDWAISGQLKGHKIGGSWIFTADDIKNFVNNRKEN
jgi:excisionase family DNA binding protein